MGWAGGGARGWACPGLWLWNGDGQEVCGSVFSSRLLGPHRLAVGAQAHEHGLLLVPPLGRGVGVVPVFLDPLHKLAVSAELPLENTNTTSGLGVSR